jgi:hypothetical protein
MTVSQLPVFCLRGTNRDRPAAVLTLSRSERCLAVMTHFDLPTAIVHPYLTLLIGAVFIASVSTRET